MALHCSKHRQLCTRQMVFVILDNATTLQNHDAVAERNIMPLYFVDPFINTSDCIALRLWRMVIKDRTEFMRYKDAPNISKHDARVYTVPSSERITNVCRSCLLTCLQKDMLTCHACCGSGHDMTTNVEGIPCLAEGFLDVLRKNTQKVAWYCSAACRECHREMHRHACAENQRQLEHLSMHTLAIVGKSLEDPLDPPHTPMPSPQASAQVTKGSPAKKTKRTNTKTRRSARRAMHRTRVSSEVNHLEHDAWNSPLERATRKIAFDERQHVQHDGAQQKKVGHIMQQEANRESRALKREAEIMQGSPSGRTMGEFLMKN